ncbi:GPN-loop GTPase 2 [Aplysia californica]|uniref:GPN-loop GTPase 2 n=1 Tax=Aplysia californica TaxID=6500 RepID=A0ABM0JZJ8_APLCA|nr:GPN-loop GTPase 2 [Aplysia californica]
MFGQIVIGPPGAGKTTYCHGMQQFLSSLKREVAVINMDPANDILPYPCDVDISELVSLEDVMAHLRLGPNGGLVYCMEYLEQNIDWLKAKLDGLKDKYLLFDFPGQVELFTHHNSVKNILEKLTSWDVRLTAVHLVDSHYCTDPGKFVAVLLTSLNTMLQLSLPHVNVLSKVDLIEKHGKLAFNPDFYTDVLDLQFLLDLLQDDPLLHKYKKLNEALVGIVEDYSLVSFLPLSVENKESMLRLLKAIDKCNGYGFGPLEDRSIESLMSCAVGAEFEYEKIKDVREKFMNTDDDMEEDT